MILLALPERERMKPKASLCMSAPMRMLRALFSANRGVRSSSKSEKTSITGSCVATNVQRERTSSKSIPPLPLIACTMYLDSFNPAFHVPTTLLDVNGESGPGHLGLLLAFSTVPAATPSTRNAFLQEGMFGPRFLLRRPCIQDEATAPLCVRCPLDVTGLDVLGPGFPLPFFPPVPSLMFPNPARGNASPLSLVPAHFPLAVHVS
eukprot:CAMPEP_0113927630 /NCGR_PEP_ID=MMETSP1159-20121227/4403_1 /TAXON_ID=88271 /ORGANISM="Picocystis salinarum" /LENGTH=205 /DNA_ID=CAMNT_0000928127 /DNA_START=380 /DNA_END=993 /DNA_ORIENTATION=+ /assembly_acc=CAM_ASM_000767